MLAIARSDVRISFLYFAPVTFQRGKSIAVVDSFYN